MGQLGFHVQFEGLIADVETSGFAWLAGLRQGSRLVEVWTASIVLCFIFCWFLGIIEYIVFS